MMRRFVLLLLLLLPLGMAACSTGNSDAPADNEPHPEAWLADHPAAALAVANFADCTSCHGEDLKGIGNAVSCYSCHAFNTVPPFIIHPADWTDAYFDHRNFAATNGSTTCANCHGSDLHGSIAAPSCFSTDFDGRNCHPGGPGSAPHPLDGSFLNSALHGPDAKADLTICQACHGLPGGAGSNPRFNVGISSVTSTGCEGCHNDFTAHPSVGARDNAHWYGATVTHADAGNLAVACALCHGASLGGPADGGVGPACTDCHNVDPVANSSGCVSCHNLPPDGNAPAGNLRPNRQGQHNRAGHGLLISSTPSETCVRCHNGVGVGTNAHFDATAPADINILHPDASDTISAVSDATNTTCTGACHVVSGNFDRIFNHDNETWY